MSVSIIMQRGPHPSQGGTIPRTFTCFCGKDGTLSGFLKKFDAKKVKCDGPTGRNRHCFERVGSPGVSFGLLRCPRMPTFESKV